MPQAPLSLHTPVSQAETLQFCLGFRPARARAHLPSCAVVSLAKHDSQTELHSASQQIRASSGPLTQWPLAQSSAESHFAPFSLFGGSPAPVVLVTASEVLVLPTAPPSPMDVVAVGLA